MSFKKPELELISIRRDDIVTSSYCDGAPVQMGDVYGSGCNYDPNIDDDE